MRLKVLVSLILMSVGVWAQENSLLWRITGKNLNKPSYVYGTMHVKDKRVFYANDSLPQFIASCDLFALELHPDSLNALLFNMKEKDSISDYHRYFNEEEYKMVDEKIQKDLGINLRELKTKNLRHLRMLLSPTKKRNDDYPTFLDGYLLNIAMRYNRGLIGLESNKSQELALNTFSKEREIKEEIVELSREKKSEDKYAKMIKSYTSENIEDIYNALAGISVELSENVLDRRNEMMVRTIDSILRSNTLFAACGSAHLGGEKGIIKLLRKMGYTVTPVISKKKNYLNSDKLPFHFDSYWQKISMPSFGVNYALPGQPIVYKKDIFLSETKMYMDVSNGSVYMILPVSITIDNMDKRAMFDKVAEAMQKKAPFGAEVKKTFANDGKLDYMEIKFEIKMGFNICARLFIENNILYDFLIVSPANYNIEPEANYFFSAIDIYKPVEQATFYYTNPNWNFEVNFPGKPQEIKSLRKSDGSNIDQLSLKSSDNIAGVHYIMECVEAGEGRHYANDTSVLNEVYNRFKQEKRIMSLKDSSFLLQGNSAKQLVAVFDDYSTVICWTIMRGFKFYSIMAITTQKNYEAGVYKPVFSSFNFMNPKLTEYKWQNFPFVSVRFSGSGMQSDTLLRAKLPSPLRKNPADLLEGLDLTPGDDETALYTSYEKVYGITYYCEKVKESDYYYTVSDSLYWKKMEKKLMSYNDTLLSVSKLNFKDLDGKRFVIKPKNNTYTKYYDIFNFGDHYIKFFVNIPDKAISDRLLGPLENVEYKGEFKKEFISDTSAFRKLIDDYYAEDSIRNSKAGDAFYGFKVTDNIFPQFTAAFERGVKDTAGNISTALMEKFDEFSKATALPYVKNKLFVNRNDSVFDEDFLIALAKYKTAETQAMIGTFLTQRLHKASEYGRVFYQYRDSLELAKPFYPELFSAIKKDTAENGGLIYLTKVMLDSALINYSILKPYENDMVNYAMRYINAEVKDKEFMSYYFPDNILEVLSRSDNKELLDKLMLSLQQSKNAWGRYYSVVYGLKNKSTPNTKIMADLAKIPYLRTMLYAELEKNKHTDLFPAAYKNQKALAEGDLIYKLADYEYEPTEVKFVKELKITFEEKEVNFYIFKVSLRGEESPYIGFTGPYEVGKSELINSGDHTGLGNEYQKGLEEVQLYQYLYED